MSGFVPRALLAEKEAENARLRAELSALAEQVGRLAETNSALVAEIAKLNDRVAELLAVAQRKKSKQPETKAKEAPPAVEGAALVPIEITWEGVGLLHQSYFSDREAMTA